MNSWTLCLLIGSFVPIPLTSARGEACPNQRFLETARIPAEIEANSAGSYQRSITFVTCEGCHVAVTSTSPVVFKSQPLRPGLGVLGQKDRALHVERARRNGTSLAVRVMDRLQKAEAHESNTHLRQDIRQAWIVVSFAQKGMSDAFVQSSYVCYGVHPDEVFPHWLAEQRAKLGNEFYLFYNDAGVLRPDVPRIPTTADRLDRQTTIAESPAHGASCFDEQTGSVPSKERIV